MNTIDFKGILVNAIRNPNNKRNIPAYFIREYANAMHYNYTKEVFFDNLNFELDKLKLGITPKIKAEYDRILKEKKEWSDKAQKEELIDYNIYQKPGQINSEEHHRKYNKDIYNRTEKELSELTLDTVAVEGLCMKDLQLLKNGLAKASREVQLNEPPMNGQQVPATFVNKFDTVLTDDIYKHFKAGLVDKGFLTEQELNEYLKAAFELKKIPQTLFKFKNAPMRDKIYTVFYTYYLELALKPHAKQTQYVGLLGNYFEGYDNEIIRTNWARAYKPKKH